MTETPSDTITFRDRTMRYVKPDSWQMAMWYRTATRFGKLANADDREWSKAENQAEFGNLLDKFFSIVLSVFPDQADKDWIEIQMIEGKMSGEDLLELVKQMGFSTDEQARRVED